MLKLKLERKKSTTNPIPVIYAVDYNYIVGVGTSVCSLLIAAPYENYIFYFLHSSEINENDKLKLINDVKRLSPYSTANFIEINGVLNDAYTDRWFSVATYYRLLIPWLLPTCSKVIYSDADVIFRTGLTEIFESLDMGIYYVAGVNLDKFNNPEDRMFSYIKSLNLNPSEYINSGFMIINCELQRRHKLLSNYLKLIGRPFHCLDQDIINLVCQGKITYIDRRYNIDPRRNSFDLGNSKVLHYIGVKKPWITVVPGWKEWIKAYKQSSFFNSSVYHEMERLRRKNILNGYIKRFTPYLPSFLSLFYIWCKRIYLKYF